MDECLEIRNVLEICFPEILSMIQSVREVTIWKNIVIYPIALLICYQEKLQTRARENQNGRNGTALKEKMAKEYIMVA